MSVACEADVCGHFLWGSDTSNKPLEWTGRHQLSASQPPGFLPATQGQRSKDRRPKYEAFILLSAAIRTIHTLRPQPIEQ